MISAVASARNAVHSGPTGAAAGRSPAAKSQASTGAPSANAGARAARIAAMAKSMRARASGVRRRMRPSARPGAGASATRSARASAKTRWPSRAAGSEGGASAPRSAASTAGSHTGRCRNTRVMPGSARGSAAPPRGCAGSPGAPPASTAQRLGGGAGPMRRMLSSVMPAMCGVRITLSKAEERVVGRQRLGREDVERRAGDPPGLERLEERRLVHHRPARHVDEERRGLHPGEAARRRSARWSRASAGRQSATMSASAISASSGAARDPPRQPRRRAGVGDHLEAEAIAGDAARARARRAHADDPERASGKLAALRRRAPAPRASRRARRSRSTARKRRSSTSATMITCSATVRALAPGTLATSTPAAVAAATGIMSSPAPWRIAARSRGATPNSASRQRRAHDDDVRVAAPRAAACRGRWRGAILSSARRRRAWPPPPGAARASRARPASSGLSGLRLRLRPGRGGRLDQRLPVAERRLRGARSSAPGRRLPSRRQSASKICRCSACDWRLRAGSRK